VIEALKGVVMELMIVRFHFSESSGQNRSRRGFRDVNWALLVGSVPRKAGMERKDLLGITVRSLLGKASDRKNARRCPDSGHRKSVQHKLPDRDDNGEIDPARSVGSR